jgi:hypothetical protein
MMHRTSCGVTLWQSLTTATGCMRSQGGHVASCTCICFPFAISANPRVAVCLSMIFTGRCPQSHWESAD